MRRGFGDILRTEAEREGIDVVVGLLRTEGTDVRKTAGGLMITANDAADTALRLRPNFGARRYVDVERRVVFRNAAPHFFNRLEFGGAESRSIVESERGVSQAVPTRSFGTAKIEVDHVVRVAGHAF